MLEFIKMFGLGILYTILFPFIVAIFALALVYVFVSYLVMESISIFGFFFGYTFTSETELEKKLREMKEDGEQPVEIQEEKPVETVSYTYNSQGVVVEEEKGSDE